MRISDWSSDVCSSDLGDLAQARCVHRGIPVIELPADAGIELVARDVVTAVDREHVDQRRIGGIPAFVRVHPGVVGAEAERAGTGFQAVVGAGIQAARSEEHTSELQSLMRISYAVFCLNK